MPVHQENDRTAEPARTRNEVLAEKAKHLLREGNVRRIVVRDSRERTVLDIPVNAGLVAAVLAPAVAAAGAIAAIVGPWSIEVEHRDDNTPEERAS
ncbi:DUF4342 domain-containing protein [Amycolatopsis orientalis]|uniref:DUF4342 domain-containing protein n=1 Tax=Amycolatopsis orientalis TaxID=31958 RepID=UPI00055D203A|nr:DUF4342 domain-containing protein [Amycolatopsis orientalis]